MKREASIESAAELYVHAIAIEREAAERYAQLYDRMAEQGSGELAELFRALAGFELEHLEALQRRTAGMALPALSADYTWHDEGVPLTAGEALSMALQAEKRACAFFRHVHRTAADPGLRALAHEMAAEEEQHIEQIRAMKASQDPGTTGRSAGSGLRPVPGME